MSSITGSGSAATRVLTSGCPQSGGGKTRAAMRLASQQPLGVIAGLIVVALFCTAVLAPLLAPFNPQSLVGIPYTHPGSRFLLGTDSLGRDVTSRVIWGSRVSLYVGVAGALTGVTLGVALGAICSYAGGAVDLVSVRIVDGAQAFPPLVLALVLMGTFGSSVINVIAAVALIYVPITARVIRPVVLGLKSTQHIEAAKASGSSGVRILLRHIVPNTVPSALVLFSLAIGNAIVIEASLSFLGVGIPPNIASWGGMINTAGIQSLAIAPWIMFAPAAAIGVAVYAFNLLGDSVRDVLDPRLRSA